jgi:prevent-host-death family protein
MRKRLGEILDAASAGERIRIERDHRPLAVLVSIEDAERIDAEAREASIARRLAALDALVEFGKRYAREHPRQPGDLGVVEQIRKDREERTQRILRASRGLPPEDPVPLAERLDADVELADASATPIPTVAAGEAADR